MHPLGFPGDHDLSRESFLPIFSTRLKERASAVDFEELSVFYVVRLICCANQQVVSPSGFQEQVGAAVTISSRLSFACHNLTSRSEA